MARVLILSPYHGGSHRAFVQGLIGHSRHTFDVLSLPARFWKWRMRGAALLLAARARQRKEPVDLVLATDMLNLAEFRGLSGLSEVPHVLYMHENQISYPLPPQDRLDAGFGFVNVASAQAADAVVFNSHAHRDAFFTKLPGFLGAMPDCPLPAATTESLAARSRVLPVGCELEEMRALRPAQTAEKPPPAPLILWNHRWEFDKAPEDFFSVLDRLDGAGLAFRLALAGENSQVEPRPFLAARERYADRLVQFGWVPDRSDYGHLLGRSDIVISTARQENFGISVVEAIACGAWPLLPRRLSYPEVLPADWHAECLYDGLDDLHGRLSALLQNGLPETGRREGLSRAMLRYDWRSLIGTYDDLIAGMVPARNTQP